MSFSQGLECGAVGAAVGAVIALFLRWALERWEREATDRGFRRDRIAHAIRGAREETRLIDIEDKNFHAARAALERLVDAVSAMSGER